MDEFYYEDSNSELRGPCTRQVLNALDESGLLGDQTLIRSGKDGFPFPYAVLKSLVRPPESPVTTTSNQASTVLISQWGFITNGYFLIGQIFCVLSAILVPFQVLFVHGSIVDSPSSPESGYLMIFLSIVGLLEVGFWGAIFFVIAYVKRQRLKVN